jgi:hypothetical protein
VTRLPDEINVPVISEATKKPRLMQSVGFTRLLGWIFPTGDENINQTSSSKFHTVESWRPIWSKILHEM